MIELNVTKKLLTTGGHQTLSVDMQLPENDFCAFFGQSGTGKTTTLRMLAGLTIPDTGKIVVNNAVWFDSTSSINIPIQNRNIGFVFQDYALFPTMTVRKNIEYACGKNNEKAGSIIELMGLQKFLNAFPNQLSGGQRQRVALARTLARSPEILLLDEPLSALDNEMRSALQDEICRIHDLFHLTTIIVTHDISEIFKVARSVAVFGNNTISRKGSPEEVFGHNLSTKFRVTGVIVDIKHSDIAAVVTVLVGSSQTRVVIDTDEVAQYKVGQSVIVAAKAFTPVLYPIT